MKMEPHKTILMVLGEPQDIRTGVDCCSGKLIQICTLGHLTETETFQSKDLNERLNDGELFGKV